MIPLIELISGEIVLFNRGIMINSGMIDPEGFQMFMIGILVFPLLHVVPNLWPILSLRIELKKPVYRHFFIR